jgi:hypothetical protein
MKALIKYLLSLCILVLGIYSQLPAHADKERALYSLQKNADWLAYANICASQYYKHLVIKSSSSRTEKENCQIDAAENEVEEYELISSKKNADNSTSAATFLPTTGACFFGSASKTLLFESFFSHAVSSRYLIFQIFRI